MHAEEHWREFPQHPVLGVGVVVVQDGAVLLIERGHAPLEGLWSVPGGVVELGETVRAAAEREVLEETGIAVGVDRLLTVVERMERDAAGKLRFHYLLVEFAASPRDARSQPRAAPRAASDARQARWVAWGELGHYPLVPDLDEVLALVR
ncbi:MAG: NUDIX hydrolase [Terriglobales bacterium]